MSTASKQPSLCIFMKWLDFAQNCFWFCALLSLIGFALPWFKSSESAGSWYGGYNLLFDYGLYWISLVFAGYGLLIILGHNLLLKNLRMAGVITILSLTVTLSALVVVGFAMADVIYSARTLDTIVYGIGLFIMLPNHAAMIFGALAVWIMRVIQESLGLLNKESS